MDMIELENSVEQLHKLKGQIALLRKLADSESELIKAYLKLIRKKSLKIKGFSLVLASKKISQYDTRKIQSYLAEGKIPSDIVKSKSVKEFLTITATDDIQLVGNKFVIGKEKDARD